MEFRVTREVGTLRNVIQYKWMDSSEGQSLTTPCNIYYAQSPQIAGVVIFKSLNQLRKTFQGWLLLTIYDIAHLADVYLCPSGR